jgi:hypothetical protein
MHICCLFTLTILSMKIFCYLSTSLLSSNLDVLLNCLCIRWLTDVGLAC